MSSHTRTRARTLTDIFKEEREKMQEDLFSTGIVHLRGTCKKTLAQLAHEQKNPVATKDDCNAPANPSPEQKPSTKPRSRSIGLDEIRAYCEKEQFGALSPKEKEQYEREHGFSPRSVAPSSSSSVSFMGLHQLCASATPSLEMVRITTSTSPFSVREKDRQGNLPLHISVNRDDPVPLVVYELLNRYPESAKIKDNNGNLPLFLACRRPKVSAGVIRALLQVYPEAGRMRIYGSTALSHLVHTGSASPECIRLLLDNNPQAASIRNGYGNLPLHYLCAHRRAHLDSVCILMTAYPEGIQAKNNAGETPISRALKSTELGEMANEGSSGEQVGPEPEEAEEMVMKRERARVLLNASAREALSLDQLALLRQLNWEARRNAVCVCDTILRAAPASSGAGNESKLEQSTAIAIESPLSTVEAVNVKASAFERTICGSEDVWRLVVKFL